jgi:hypothetical protein
MVKRRKCWFIPKKNEQTCYRPNIACQFYRYIKIPEKSNNPCVVDFFLGNIIMGLGCDIQDNIL